MHYMQPTTLSVETSGMFSISVDTLSCRRQLAGICLFFSSKQQLMNALLCSFVYDICREEKKKTENCRLRNLFATHKRIYVNVAFRRRQTTQANRFKFNECIAESPINQTVANSTHYINAMIVNESSFPFNSYRL